MRAHEFLQLLNEATKLRTGTTKGDLVETFFGAAITAAYIKYPNPATEIDLLGIIRALDQNHTFTSTNFGEPADKIIFINSISQPGHKAALQSNELPNTIEQVKIFLSGLLARANYIVKSSNKISIAAILKNGQADEIKIRAIGGEGQSESKVDVDILHSEENGTVTQEKIEYSLKLKNRAKEKWVPVSQNSALGKGDYDPETGKGSRNPSQFWSDLGVIITGSANTRTWQKFQNDFKELYLTRVSIKKLENVKARKNSALYRYTAKSMAHAVRQINQMVQDVDFLHHLESFLDIHVNKGNRELELLTIEPGNTHIAKLDNMQRNSDKINLTANYKPTGNAPTLEIFNTYNDKTTELLEIRLTTAGGYWRTSKNQVPEKMKTAKKKLYAPIRYTLKISLGPAYDIIAGE